MRQFIPVVFGVVVLCMTASAEAQFATVSAEQVLAAAGGNGKVLLVDVRSAEEYQAGHISGAVHIPAERVSAEKGRLPKEKAASVIFYCRGVG